MVMKTLKETENKKKKKKLFYGIKVTVTQLYYCFDNFSANSFIYPEAAAASRRGRFTALVASSSSSSLTNTFDSSPPSSARSLISLPAPYAFTCLFSSLTI